MPTFQIVSHEEEDMKPFPCKTVNRAQNNKMGKISAKHRREGGWFLALDAENGTMKNACPYQNKFGEKIQNISGTVATAQFSRVYSINLYMCLLIHTCIHLDMLNINLK